MSYSRSVTFAAIAGVHPMVLCIFKKLYQHM